MKMKKFQKEKRGKRLIDLRKNFNPNVLFALNVSSLLKWSFTNPNQKQNKRRKPPILLILEPYQRKSLKAKKKIENWFLF
jgi:hypothetical protein